jgi:hypothetical protein
MKVIAKNEVVTAMRHSSLAYAAKETATPMFCITEAWDTVYAIHVIENVTRSILKTTGILFKVTSKKNYWELKTNKVGERVMAYLTHIQEIQAEFPLHRFNPFVELFLRVAGKQDLFVYMDNFSYLTRHETAGLARLADLLNGVIRDMREEGNSAIFNKKVNDFKRSPNKNYRELLHYIQAMFDRYSRLLIIRIDLSYRKPSQWPTVTRSPVTADEVKIHWRKMQRALKEKLLKATLVGFAYKIEYGLQKGFHIHALLMLDGSKVREDITIAQLVGEHWRDKITEGNGLYFNCNAFKGGYKDCGIGMISHDQTDARYGLEKAAMYLTKVDYYIAMAAPELGKVFGKGAMPEKKSGRGRPRHVANSQLE